MSLLTIRCHKYFTYVIIYWVLEIILRLMIYLQSDFFTFTQDIIQNEYMFVIFLNAADLLSGFLVLYTNQSSKTKRNNIEKDILSPKDPKNELIYEESGKAPKKNFYIKVIIIVILDYISRSFFWISYAITGVKSEDVSHLLEKDVIITLGIFMRYIFSIFILKVTIYKHNVCSIISIGIGFVILLITDFLLIVLTVNSIKIDKTLYYVGILLLRGISFPYEDTLVKQIFSENNILPESFQFLRGLGEMILIILITPILFFSFDLENKFNFEPENIITAILYTLAEFVKAYFLLKIIYHFSSQSVPFLTLSESLGGTITEIIKIFKDENKDADDFILITLEILGIFIILFSSLVYDEVIIINKWKLNENVKIGIINRGELEMKNMNKLDNNPLHLKLTLMGEEDFKKVYDDNENEEKQNDEGKDEENEMKEINQN